jgi:uncharacterized membrane protein
VKIGIGLLLVAAVGAATSLIARRRTRFSLPTRRDGAYATVRAVTIDRPVDEVREMVRDPGYLAVAFGRPVVVGQLGPDQARYRVGDEADGTRPVEVTVETSEWMARWWVEAGPLAHEGRLTLAPAPADRGTELRVALRYPEGRLRHRVAVSRGRDPDQWLRTTLRRLKSVMECGQLVTAMAESSGRSPAAERVTRVVRGKLATGGRP